ncbi:hypothetical protein Vretifemale_17189 [Volvox reticuliferus]|uniref:Uncharacterized protein n=1 Tax=Volvox reticuliferus TaxID=1737510 RepID=A0A8J4CYP8_9CHLO|nr:hypothetical protein Vretifemale_17189 [Volvox reticuliferus]GIL89417.1 hypothetical protein Vretifemale_17189 [Volvox reticuliferus]
MGRGINTLRHWPTYITLKPRVLLQSAAGLVPHGTLSLTSLTSLTSLIPQAAWPHMKRGASIINTSRQGRKTGLSYWLYEVVLGLEGPLRPLHSNLDPVTALVWRDCKVRCLPPCMTPFSKLFSLPPQHS